MYTQACKAIDAAHHLDPNMENNTPAEFLYAQRMVEMLEWFAPNASESAKLAARCQHFRRWEIPRDTYPMDRQGYHQWRNKLYVYQANEAAKVLQEVGFDSETISEVKTMMKKPIASEGAQLIEDLACLVFFKYYALDFAGKHTSEKVQRIVAITLRKMSEVGRKKLLELDLKEAIRALVK